MLTGLSGTMCLPTGRPMPERSRRDEAIERPTTPFPPRILEPKLLSLPAISGGFRSSKFPNRRLFLLCVLVLQNNKGSKNINK